MTTMTAPSGALGTSPIRGQATVQCTSCGTSAVPYEPFCAHCGTRVAVGARGTPPADVAATRSLQLALLAILATVLMGGLGVGVIYLVSDAARLTEAAIGLELSRFLVVGALAVLAIRSGVRGIRRTADGVLRRRGWAIAGIVLAGFFGLLVTGSFAAVLWIDLA
jgi:hypothetical protein